jgi:hypothetical protein
MRALTADEISMCDGGMSGQCVAEMGLNYVGTGGAIAVTIGSAGMGFVALAASALSLSNWYRDCGPSANYGDKVKMQ